MRTLSVRKIAKLKQDIDEVRKYFLISRALGAQDCREALNNRNRSGNSRSILGLYYDAAVHDKLIINGTTYYDVITVNAAGNNQLLYSRGHAIEVNTEDLVPRFKEIYTEVPNANISETHII